MANGQFNYDTGALYIDILITIILACLSGSSNQPEVKICIAFLITSWLSCNLLICTSCSSYAYHPRGVIFEHYKRVDN